MDMGGIWAKMSDPVEQPALTTVPTALLRKRRQLNKERVARAVEKKLQDQKKAGKAKAPFKRAEYFVNESYRSTMNTKRMGRLKHTIAKVPESVSILFVMRVTTVRGPMPQSVRKILQSLRLNELNNAVVVQRSDKMIAMLRVVEPYITWGYPSLRSVHNLVFKYGYGQVKDEKVALSSNAIIENTFAEQGMLCIEDLVKQLYEVGPHFDAINKFMCVFKLTPPKGGFRRVATPFKQNGAWGNRAEKINSLIRKML